MATGQNSGLESDLDSTETTFKPPKPVIALLNFITYLYVLGVQDHG